MEIQQMQKTLFQVIVLFGMAVHTELNIEHEDLKHTQPKHVL